MLLFLAHDAAQPERAAFSQLAGWLDARAFELVRVVSCTFPGRPEPREAAWSGPTGRPMLTYRYEPEAELRALLGQAPESAEVLDQLEREHPEAFISLDELSASLRSLDYMGVRRAGAAWRLRAKFAASASERAAAERVLIEALSRECGEHTRRVASQELGACASAQALEALERSSQDDPDLEVRMYAHQALGLVRHRVSLRLDRTP